MTQKLPIRPHASAGHRHPSPIRRTLIHDDCFDDHRLRILFKVMRRVGDGRPQQLLDHARAFLVREPERLHGGGHRHATHHLGDEVGFLGRDADGTEVGFHGGGG